MFLQWINQILGCLDSPLITVIGQLLIRISQIYPKAVQLPLRIFMEKEIYNYKQCEEFLKTKYVLLIIICILNKRKKKVPPTYYYRNYYTWIILFTNNILIHINY